MKTFTQTVTPGTPVSVTCTPGKQVLGGGAQVVPGNANDNALSQSVPIVGGWQATFNSPAIASASLSVWVICANVSP
jgi:hypothetical protein